MGDHKLFQCRIIELYRSLHRDGVRFSLPIIDKDLQYIDSRLSAEGASFVMVTLPLLGKALDAGLVRGMYSNIPHIRTVKGSRLPCLYYRVFRLVFRDDGTLAPNADQVAIQFLRQCLLLNSKAERPFSDNEKMLFKQAYSIGQANLRKVKLPVDSPVLETASRLIEKILSRFPLNTPFDPKQGPGAVAEGYKQEEKWDFKTWPSQAEREFPFLLYGTPNIAMHHRVQGIPLLLSETRACFVPKDFRGPRLISVEPAAMQYLQQGMMQRLMSWLEHSHLFSLSCKLQDQNHNRDLGEISWANEMSTVDLKTASDLVSAPLVWRLFNRVPNLRRKLFALRSSFINFEDERVRLVSFAPMGSAICFPVETIVFWAISMAVLKEQRPRDSFWVLARELRVFGDDIIIPNSCVQQLITFLSSVGCSVNTQKTCVETPFRETCGGEWFAGVSVSITRNKRYSFDAKDRLSDYPVLLSLQQKFFCQGYKETASTLLAWTKKLAPVVVYPFDYLSRKGKTLVDIPHVAYGDTFSYDGVKVRFHKGYQRVEARIPVPCQRNREWRSGGTVRLLSRLVSSLSDRVAERDSNVRFAWRSIPSYFGVSSLVPV